MSGKQATGPRVAREVRRSRYGGFFALEVNNVLGYGTGPAGASGKRRKAKGRETTLGPAPPITDPATALRLLPSRALSSVRLRKE